MSNNYDMAFFSREQSIAGKDQLTRPYVLDDERLGYRPRYPEEEAARAAMRRQAIDLVGEARRRQAEDESARAAAAQA